MKTIKRLDNARFLASHFTYLFIGMFWGSFLEDGKLSFLYTLIAIILCITNVLLTNKSLKLKKQEYGRLLKRAVEAAPPPTPRFAIANFYTTDLANNTVMNTLKLHLIKTCATVDQAIAKAKEEDYKELPTDTELTNSVVIPVTPDW